MAIVYIRNKDGKPLMPTTRCGHVRILLKKKKARVVETTPFTIQLNYETADVTQPLFLGIDPGRTNIGMSVISTNGDEKLSAQITTRNKEIPRLMTERKAHRQKHRKCKRRDKRRRRARAAGTTKAPTFERRLPGCEKPMVLHDIRNKKARFNHRTRTEGWLTPTANQLLLTHLNAVKLLTKYVPITDVVIEFNRFSFMELENPHIRPWEYQRGPLYGYKGDVNLAVSASQERKCLLCNQPIAHYHHLVPRHLGGSNTLANIAGLCEEHHALVHTNKEWKTRLAKKKDGLNKKYGALGVLNQIIPRLDEELGKMFPDHAYAVSGRDTKAYRDDQGVAKDHYLDAYCIASVVAGNEATKRGIKPIVIRQFRRHDRQACHQEMLNRKYYLDGKMVATNRHRAYEQQTGALNKYIEELHKTLGEKEVQSVVSRLVVKEHPTRMKDMRRYLPGSLFVCDREQYILRGYNGRNNGLPNYLVDTGGVKHIARKCKFIQNNKGLCVVG